MRQLFGINTRLLQYPVTPLWVANGFGLVSDRLTAFLP